MWNKPKPKAPIITIAGTPGAGKTSLAGLFPNPIFVQAEDAQTVFEQWDEDVQPSFFLQLPQSKWSGETFISTREALKDQLRSLLTEEHDFKTLVIDSVSSLHSLFEGEVAAKYKVTNIAEAAGGYGKGWLEIAEYHRELQSIFATIRERKNIAVVFLSHVGVKKKKDLPDADEYSVYTLDLHEKALPFYVNHVDAVLYLRKENAIMGKETDKKTGRVTKFGKIVETGERELITTSDGRTGYVDAKNRFNLDPSMPVPAGTNPLLANIKFFEGK